MPETEWRNGEPYVPMVPTDTMIEFLNENLGKSLVHHIVTNGTLGPWVSPLAVSRIFSAYRAMLLISHLDGFEVARAWMIGMNPELNDEAPADAIRKDLFLDVAMAVRSYLRNG
jgi:hypothetical protein